jgi:hypothetical protein
MGGDDPHGAFRAREADVAGIAGHPGAERGRRVGTDPAKARALAAAEAALS